MVGLYCATFTEDGKHVAGTGKIIGHPQAGHYLVEIYARGTAVVTHIRLVPYTDMLSWRFYRTEEAMANDCGSLPSLVPAPLPGKEGQEPSAWRVEVELTRGHELSKKRLVVSVIANDEKEATQRAHERLVNDRSDTLNILSLKKVDSSRTAKDLRYWHVMIREHRSGGTLDFRDRLYHVVADSSGKAMSLGINCSMAAGSAYTRSVLWVASVAEEKRENPLQPYEVRDWTVRVLHYDANTIATISRPYRVVASNAQAAADEALRRAGMVHIPDASAFLTLEVHTVDLVPDTERTMLYTPIK